MRAPTPPTERKRLSALRSYEVLDTPPEWVFDDLVQIATTICQTPIAAVSLVDENRQWFKAFRGTDLSETHRDASFCAYAILEPGEIFVVQDATKDVRFSDNPLVLGAPNIRFYAGIPLVSAGGHPVGTICVIDRTPRLLAEDQIQSLRALGRQVVVQLELRKHMAMQRQQALDLSDARDRAVESAAAKEAFLATVSHELRTPMNGVIGVAGMLRRTGLSVEQARLVDTMEESAQGLMSVLGDIIEYSSAQTGNLQIRTMPMQPTRLIQELARVFRPQADAKDISLVAVGSVDETLHGDVVRIRQALTALLDNAIKYTLAGSVRLDVRETGNSAKISMVRFTVEDTGVGIPKDKQRQVLESFRQGETGHTRDFAGAGLGLSTCRNLAERMGGRFDFESIPGVGSKFWFEVPLAKMETEILPIMGGLGDIKNLIGSRVLVAEDNTTNALVLVSMLERHGCVVRAVENGLEALDAIKGDPFDVVLMDLQMPKMDGLRATREMRGMANQGSRVPVIAITASALESDRSACAEAGMNDFISKPITEETVLSALSRWVDLSASLM